jgi:hypothetical protein
VASDGFNSDRNSLNATCKAVRRPSGVFAAMFHCEALARLLETDLLKRDNELLFCNRCECRAIEPSRRFEEKVAQLISQTAAAPAAVREIEIASATAISLTHSQAVIDGTDIPAAILTYVGPCAICRIGHRHPFRAPKFSWL